VTVEGNTVDHNSNYGIYLETSTGGQVIGNATFSNARGFERAASGIRLYHATGNTVSSNVSHHNEDSGIELFTSSNNNLVVNNVSYDNGDHGVDILASTDNRVVSNSVYRNVTAGINAEGGSTGTSLANNISVDSGIDSPRTEGAIRVDSQSRTGTTIDYDVVSVPASQVLIVWGTVDYSSLTTLRAATGQEAHGIQADPKWASPATGDFRLTPGSPAVDSADSGVSGESATDIHGNPRVDDPSTPDTGAGPHSYDDRGAHELPPTDLPPTAVVTVTPSSGTAPLQVAADASGSTDTDATPIATYRFDFGDGSAVVGPQSQATAAHT
jgi:parallel beta-helix repeat protein